MTIYLDYNIYLSIINNEDESSYTFAKISNLKDEGWIFPYSPAHMEEIAVKYPDQTALTSFEIRLIKRISDCCEFLPGQMNLAQVQNMLRQIQRAPASGEKIKLISTWQNILHQHKCGLIQKSDLATQLVHENPLACMERVLDGLDLTGFALNNDVNHLGRRNKKSLNNHARERGFNISGKKTFEEIQKQYKLGPNRLNSVSYDKIFDNPNLLKLLNEKCSEGNVDLSLSGQALNHQHSCKEIVITTILNTLEIAGYHQEKSNKSTKIRSRMHDVSHAIYGSTAEYFVTNDSRFYHKLKATFYFLNLPCKVLSLREFLDSNLFWALPQTILVSKENV